MEIRVVKLPTEVENFTRGILLTNVETILMVPENSVRSLEPWTITQDDFESPFSQLFSLP